MPEPMSEVRYQFFTPRPSRIRSRIASTSVPLSAALPRITRLIALAMKLDDVLRQNPDLDSSELASRGRISRTRLTQILNLLNLAPDIQERLLLLPPLAKGRENVSEKTLRRIAAEWCWERQREQFEALLSRRGAQGAPSARRFASVKDQTSP